jgi:hypothetical protein
MQEQAAQEGMVATEHLALAAVVAVDMGLLG